MYLCIFMCINFPPACVHVYHVRAWHSWGGQKKAGDYLELELQIVVSCCGGSGN